ncbi:transposon Ty3-I Gag-Pol polyprotein [Trichonephila clavipes]|nr:transposon Ty3-I Gag-Pol polyprotein [Trichonephila clavipes]
MPSEINQLMAREAEEKFDDYDYIKDLLLKRFKLSAEIFRQKVAWGLGVNDFEGLKNLMITDQLKRRVPGDSPFPINTRNGIDDLQLVDIKCGQTSIKAVIDTGAQISVLREDLIDKGCGEERFFEDTKDKDIQLEREEELSALALGQETDTSETNVAKSSFVKLQRMDESLRSVWGQAENKQNAYDIDDGVLVHIESICGENVKQVVLPTCKREEVMRMAHEIPL